MESFCSPNISLSRANDLANILTNFLHLSSKASLISIKNTKKKVLGGYSGKSGGLALILIMVIGQESSLI